MGLFAAIEIAGHRKVVVEVAELLCVMWVPSAADISGWVAAAPAGDGGFKGEIAAEVSDIFWFTSGMAGNKFGSPQGPPNDPKHRFQGAGIAGIYSELLLPQLSL